MASSKMFPVPQQFNMQEMIGRITQTYQIKGFSVTSVRMGAGVSIDFRKDDAGFKKFVGLALGVKANIMVQNGNMIINFSDAEWTGKIVAIAVGWILCLVPFFLGIIGCVKQSGLPNEIANDIQMIAASQAPENSQFNEVASAAVKPPEYICPNCGTQYNEPTNFCGNCGGKI
jgi:hypothetical protein